jgi:hypothetical protein
MIHEAAENLRLLKPTKKGNLDISSVPANDKERYCTKAD